MRKKRVLRAAQVGGALLFLVAIACDESAVDDNDDNDNHVDPTTSYCTTHWTSCEIDADNTCSSEPEECDFETWSADSCSKGEWCCDRSRQREYFQGLACAMDKTDEEGMPYRDVVCTVDACSSGQPQGDACTFYDVYKGEEASGYCWETGCCSVPPD